jgi:NAD(P)H-hydrate epimerase
MDSKDLTTLMHLFDRRPDSNKYDFGHVLVVGGAPGMVGAPLLAASAALRTGAGLATIAAAADVVDKLEKRVVEVMTLRLPEDNSEAFETLSDFIKARRVSAVAIGPGLDKARAGLVKDLMDSLRIPVVLDAGGLGAFDGDLSGLHNASRHNPSIILTPHQGEFERLTGEKLPVDREKIQKAVIDTARSTGTTVILKGYRSLVVTPTGETYTNTSGNPGLATAGTGDVLTGMVASLLAQGFNQFEAAKYGVYLHGLAGDIAAKAKTEPGLIASDVIETIPAALVLSGKL